MKNWATNLTADPVLCAGLAIIMLTLILAMAYFFVYWRKGRAEKRREKILREFAKPVVRFKVSAERFHLAVSKFSATAEEFNRILAEKACKDCN